MIADLLAVPEPRRTQLMSIVERLRGARSVVLTTHVQADGDGAGSEAALSAWLRAIGVPVRIVNPTPFPAMFRFLIQEGVVLDDPAAHEAALADAEVVVVLDTSEAKRVAPLDRWIVPERAVVVDHHPAGPAMVGASGVRDPSAAATGELMYDLLSLAGGPWPEGAAQGIYVGLVSDTGSFRYANTTPRVHAITAEVMARGIDPEAVYRRLFATAPRRRVELLREALAGLDTDPMGLSWIVVDPEVSDRLDATSEDFDGLIEHARSIEGTEVAILFRGAGNGSTKVSFRSNGEVDVNRAARAFGGGGHVKAAGALVAGAPGEVADRVVAALREVLKEGLASSEAAPK